MELNLDFNASKSAIVTALVKIIDKASSKTEAVKNVQDYLRNISLDSFYLTNVDPSFISDARKTLDDTFAHYYSKTLQRMKPERKDRSADQIHAKETRDEREFRRRAFNLLKPLKINTLITHVEQEVQTMVKEFFEIKDAMPILQKQLESAKKDGIPWFQSQHLCKHRIGSLLRKITECVDNSHPKDTFESIELRKFVKACRRQIEEEISELPYSSVENISDEVVKIPEKSEGKVVDVVSKLIASLDKAREQLDEPEYETPSMDYKQAIIFWICHAQKKAYKLWEAIRLIWRNQDMITMAKKIQIEMQKARYDAARAKEFQFRGWAKVRKLQELHGRLKTYQMTQAMKEAAIE